MKNIKLLTPIYVTCFMKEAFRDVAKHWSGVSFLYLLALLAVTFLLVTIKMELGLAAFINGPAQDVVEQVPLVTISKGELSIDKPAPHIIKDPDSQRPMVILDPSGSITTLDGSPAHVLVTKKELIFERSSAETRTFDLSKFGDASFDNKQIALWLNTFLIWFPIIIFLVVVPCQFVFAAVQVLIYAAIGLLIGKALKANLQYTALMRLSVMAITPVIVVDTLLHLFDQSIPGWILLSFVMAMAYLFYGIKVNTPSTDVALVALEGSALPPTTAPPLPSITAPPVPSAEAPKPEPTTLEMPKPDGPDSPNP